MVKRASTSRFAQAARTPAPSAVNAAPEMPCTWYRSARVHMRRHASRGHRALRVRGGGRGRGGGRRGLGIDDGREGFSGEPRGIEGPASSPNASSLAFATGRARRRARARGGGGGGRAGRRDAARDRRGDAGWSGDRAHGESLGREARPAMLRWRIRRVRGYPSSLRAERQFATTTTTPRVILPARRGFRNPTTRRARAPGAGGDSSSPWRSPRLTRTRRSPSVSPRFGSA